MNAKLTKVVAMASLAAFLTVGIGANVAQAKDYHFNVKNMIKMPLLNVVNNINVPNLQTANHSPFITGYPVI